MIRASNLETSTVAQGPAYSAASAQSSTPGSAQFIDSLLAASKSFSDNGTSHNGSGGTSTGTKSATGNSNAAPGTANGRAAQLPSHSQQPLVVRQLSIPQYAASANPAATGTGLQQSACTSSQNGPIAGDTPVVGNASMSTSSPSDASLASKDVFHQTNLQSMLSWIGGDPTKVVSMLSGSGAQGAKAPVAPAAKSKGGVSSAADSTVSNCDQKTSKTNAQSTATGNALNTVANPNSEVAAIPVPATVPTAIESIPPTVVAGESEGAAQGVGSPVVQGSVQPADAGVAPSTVEGNASTLASKAVQSAAPVSAPQVKNEFGAFLQTASSDAAQSSSSNPLPDAVQASAISNSSTSTPHVVPSSTSATALQTQNTSESVAMGSSADTANGASLNAAASTVQVAASGSPAPPVSSAAQGAIQNLPVAAAPMNAGNSYLGSTPEGASAVSPRSTSEQGAVKSNPSADLIANAVRFPGESLSQTAAINFARPVQSPVFGSLSHATSEISSGQVSTTAAEVTNSIPITPGQRATDATNTVVEGSLAATQQLATNSVQVALPVTSPAKHGPLTDAVPNSVSGTTPNAEFEDPSDVESAKAQGTTAAQQSSITDSEGTVSESAAPVATPVSVSNALQSAVLKAAMSAVSYTTPTASTNSASIAASTTSSPNAANPNRNPLPFAVESAGQNAETIGLRNAVSNTVASQPSMTPPNMEHPSAPHASSVSHAAADSIPASSQLAANQSNTQAASTSPSSSDSASQATSQFVPGAAATQLDALSQLRDGWLEPLQSAGLNTISVSASKSPAAAAINGKDGPPSAAKAASNDPTGAQSHVPAGTSSTQSQSGSQDSTQSGAQSQTTVPSQGQAASVPQAGSATHSAAATAHVVSPATESSTPVTSTPPRASSQATAGSENAAAAGTTAPQGSNVVNTAKLIQSIGQSEMRVGMRSSEFGNISISTSAVRGGISAQISLDHGELAKTLAAHLPEMQARLGSNQQVNLRIDVNGDRGGQGAGTQNGGSSGSGDDMRGARRQASGVLSSRSGGGLINGAFAPATATTAATASSLNARLDIRV